MAFSTQSLLLLLSFFFFLLFVSPISIEAAASASFRPKALVLPVSKDDSTNQYVVQIKQRTPSVPVKLTLDLGSQASWVHCEKGYVSSSYKPAHCNSAQCNLAKDSFCAGCFDGPKPGCNNNTCSLYQIGPKAVTIGELTQDVVSIQSTDGKNPGKAVSVDNFLFTCGATILLKGLPKGVTGMVSLGRSKLSMPSQFAAAFSFPNKFALCLSSNQGVMFFGNGPYSFLPPPGLDLSKWLVYTPLILNPVNTAVVSSDGEASTDYFIGVKGIIINKKEVRLNKAKLSIDKQGRGGTKISTTTPYTVMETSIYNAVVNTFAKYVNKAARVAAVAPFSACYNAKGLGSNRLGPAVPSINLVLQNKGVSWPISGTNLMVNVGNDVLCLGFVDGGVKPMTSIVIGTHQIEDNLLQFDLAASRLGFTSSLRFRQTTCSNFNFTSIA